MKICSKETDKIIKIQALVRGFLTRQCYKINTTHQDDAESVKSQQEDEKVYKSINYEIAIFDNIGKPFVEKGVL